MEKRDRLRFSPWLTLKAFIKYYLMVGNGRSAEAKKSSSPIMCWIYAWQILSHNMSLIYACPQVWAIIVKEGGEIWPDGGRRDSRMRTVEVLLRWRGGLTFSGAKTARFVNSSRRPAHPLREDNYFTTVQSWGWYFHMVQSRKRRKKKNSKRCRHGFLIHMATGQNTILRQPRHWTPNLWRASAWTRSSE